MIREQIEIYKCQFCDKTFSDKKICFNHEIYEELHINLYIYNEWLALQDKVSNRFFLMAETRNEKMIELFNEAVKELLDFKEKHKIKCNIAIGPFREFMINTYYMEV